MKLKHKKLTQKFEEILREFLDVADKDIKTASTELIQAVKARDEEVLGEEENLYEKERKAGKWDWRVEREEGGNERRHKIKQKMKETL